MPVKAVKIGVRRAPAPEGRTGFNRIDSVHQGDLDGVKGVYHINVFKCFTQWVVVATVQGLSEAFLLPVIAHMPSQFPFAPHGFHSYNGSEYVNRDVAAMLEKLHIEFTRGRPRCGNDYRLAETKNGAVIRKLFGTDLIPQRHAVRFDTFCCEQLNPLLNFHRPCLFPTDRPDPKKPGRVKRVYRPQDATTPLTKLAAACLVPLAGEGGRVFRRRAGAAAAWASSSLLWCAAAREESRHRAVARYLWAMLLARIYEAFPPQCPICHSQMRILAFINDAGNLKKILDHIGESSQPLRIAPARGPPLWEASAAAEQADKDPQWDSSTQPALEIEFDQRIAW